VAGAAAEIKRHGLRLASHPLRHPPQILALRMHGAGQVGLCDGIELVACLDTHRRISGRPARAQAASDVGSARTDKMDGQTG
jgi:hypothetical protein